MADLTERMDPSGRRTIVFSVPGDRRDEDIRESVRACLPAFTHFVRKADSNRRGRGYDEIPQLVRQYLLEEGIEEVCIKVVADEEPAIDYVLNMAEEGDLLVITADDLIRSWKQIINFNTDKTPIRETIPGTKVFVPEPVKRYELGEDETLVTDGRGVRLVTVEVEEAD